MAVQELEQGICQKLGWSVRYFKIGNDNEAEECPPEGCWGVEISMGIGRKKIFESQDRSPNTIKGRKQGKKAAALVALRGLKEDVQMEMNKPIVHGLAEAVTDLFDGTRIVESCPVVWREFWKNPPLVVGVDTEGNSLTPPVLVQIATDDFVILECPKSSGLSGDLWRLLNDERILKVFCDSSAQKDLVSLGLCATEEDIVDLEQYASSKMGSVSVPRGLSNLLCLTMPELGVRIAKESAAERLNNVRTFTAIEQGFRPRLLGFHDLTPQERRYAAVDAFCTLQIWKRLNENTNNQ